MLTYTTSGIFNLAQGAFSMMGAFAYWQLHTAWGWGTIPSLIMVIFVLAPLFGVVIERGIMRGLEGTSEVVRIVVTVSLMLALLGLATVLWPGGVARFNQRFFEGRAVRIGDVNVSYHRLIILAVAAAVALGLRFVLYRTRAGIAMRAVVDDRPLARLNGGRPDRSSMLAWGIGAVLAAVAGILISPEYGLSQLDLTLLVVNAFAAAVVGRLRSLPLTFLGALLIGLFEAYMAGYVASGTQLWGFNLDNLRFAISPMLLFVMMIIQPQERLRSGGVQQVRERWRVPTLRTAVWGGVALVGLTWAITELVAADRDLLDVLPGFYLALIALSLVPLTGYAGQISLAQLTFAGIGAVVMAIIGPGKTPAGLLVAVVVCAAVGALVALPALRLTGIYLALATTAFSLFMTKVVFNQQKVMPNGNRQVPPLDLGLFEVRSNRGQIMVLAAAFALVGVGLVALRRSSFGRRLTAMKDSPVACATLGLDLTRTKIVVFALSASIAGLAGALFSRTVQATSFDIVSSMSITMMAVVGGVGAVAGVFLGGMMLGALQTLAGSVFVGNAVGLFGFFRLTVADLLLVTPGFIGIGLGRNPNGLIGDIGDAYRQVGESKAALWTAAGGGAGLWVLARSGTISNWTFVGTVIVLVLAIVPLLPVLYSPIPGGRAAAAGTVLVAGMVAVGAVDWGTAIGSNGMRMVAFVGMALVVSLVAVQVHGAVPSRGRTPRPSPDMLGIDRPLTQSDAIDSEQVLGVTGELAGAGRGTA